MPIIDTQALKTDLLESDMPEQQAAAIVGALADADTGQLATKAEMEKLRGEINTKIADLRGDIKTLRWIGGTVLTFQFVLFSALIGLLWKLLVTWGG